MRRLLPAAILLAVATALPIAAQDKPAETAKTEPAKPADATTQPGPLPGHSTHGEVFNEGPRQKAYLMPGMPKINFPVTTKSPEAQQFIRPGSRPDARLLVLRGGAVVPPGGGSRQGLRAWPTGAWRWPTSTTTTGPRSSWPSASSTKPALTERETMYIDALDAYFKADADKKQGAERGLHAGPGENPLQVPGRHRSPGLPRPAALEEPRRRASRSAATWRSTPCWTRSFGPTRCTRPITTAFTCGITSRRKTRSPRRPCAGRRRRASPTCGTCRGTSTRRLKRYDDACWQQEASARVDHAHMMRDRVLPDQIHNFAHNNEWLIRDMIFVGRVRDADRPGQEHVRAAAASEVQHAEPRGSASFGRHAAVRCARRGLSCGTS